MTADSSVLVRKSRLGLALAAAVWTALAMSSACSSTGYTAKNCGATLPLYNVLDGGDSGNVPPERKTAADKGCVTLPGHATSSGGP